MATVTVIIPAHNSERYIRGAINSVLRQSYTDYELIVVNDGSTDGTHEIVAEYGDQIRYIEQDKQGVSVARNTGIKHSSSPLIAFLDSDDIWFPDKLQKQVDVILNDKNAGVLHTTWLYYLEDDRLIPFEKQELSPDDEARRIVLNNCINTSSVLVRRECLEQSGLFDPKLKFGEDFDLWLRLISKHISFRCINEPLLIYRIYPNSSSVNLAANDLSANMLMSFFQNDNLPWDLSEYADESLGSMELHLARSFLNDGDKESYSEHLCKACKRLQYDAELVKRVVNTLLPCNIIGPLDNKMKEMKYSDIMTHINNAASILATNYSVSCGYNVNYMKLLIAQQFYDWRYLELALSIALSSVFHKSKHRLLFLRIIFKCIIRRLMNTKKPHEYRLENPFYTNKLNYIHECETFSPSALVLEST